MKTFNAYKYPSLSIAASAMCVDQAAIADFSKVELSETASVAKAAQALSKLPFDDIVTLAVGDQESWPRIWRKMGKDTKHDVHVVLDAMFEHAGI